MFIEGSNDVAILHILAKKLGLPWPNGWVEWLIRSGHKERKQVFLALAEEIPRLMAISLRDRDDEPIKTVESDLVDKAHQQIANFDCRKWRRRHIESYLIWPPAIAAASGLSESEVDAKLAQSFAIAIQRDSFTHSDVPEALLNLHGKSILMKGGESDPISLDTELA